MPGSSHAVDGLGRPLVVRAIGEHDRRRFNACVAGLSTGNIFQSYEWGELRERSGWTPLRLMAERGNTPVGAATILLRRDAGLVAAYAPRGPVAPWQDGAAVRGILEAMEQAAREHGAVLLKVDPLAADPAAAAALRQAGFRRAPVTNEFGGTQPRFSWQVPLLADPSRMYGALQPGARRAIQHAERLGVEAREHGAEGLEIMIRLLESSYRRHGWLLRSRQYFYDLWDCLHSAGRVHLWLAHHAGKPVCGLLAASFGTGVWNLYTALGDDERTGAAYLLGWKMLTHFGSRGFETFNLGGIPGEFHPTSRRYDLYFFKSRFGGEAVTYIGEFDRVLAPMWYPLWNLGRRTYQQGARVLAGGRT